MSQLTLLLQKDHIKPCTLFLQHLKIPIQRVKINIKISLTASNPSSMDFSRLNFGIACWKTGWLVGWLLY